MKFSEIKLKEVICAADGERLGFVSDLDIDEESGRIRSLLVPGAYRFLGVFGRNDDITVPWDKISKMGEDLIIIDRF